MIEPFKNSFMIFEEGSKYPAEKIEKELVLEGYRLADMLSLHKFLKTGLKLPSYSHPNLDSLDEILNDPDWLEQNSGFHLRILNYPQLLHQETREKKIAFIGILDSMANSLGYNAISIQNCQQIREDLAQMHIAFHSNPDEE